MKRIIVNNSLFLITAHALKQADLRDVTWRRLEEALSFAEFSYFGKFGREVWLFENIELVIDGNVVITCISIGGNYNKPVLGDKFPLEFDLAA